MALTQANEQAALFPVICASVIGTRSAAIGSTVLFPSAPAGVYRASCVQVITTAGSAGTLVTNIIATDDFGANTTAVATNANIATQGQANGSVIFENTATANISYSVVASGTFGSCVYSIYLILERLF